METKKGFIVQIFGNKKLKKSYGPLPKDAAFAVHNALMNVLKPGEQIGIGTTIKVKAPLTRLEERAFMEASSLRSLYGNPNWMNN